MGLGKLWNRTKSWGAAGWKKAKHFGKQGLNKASMLYNKFDNATGGNAASLLGQGVGALASLLIPGGGEIAKFAGPTIGAIGGMLSNDKWKQGVTDFGNGIVGASGAKGDTSSQNKTHIPSVKKRPITNGGRVNPWVRNGVNRLM